MVRIFKSDANSMSAIAGEMLNLEYNHLLFDNGKLVPKNKIRLYPKVKSDNCTIIPRLTMGWIELISNCNLDTFITLLQAEIDKMEKTVPKKYTQMQSVLNVGIDSFCEVKVTSLLKSTSSLPLANGFVKRRITKSTSVQDRSKESCQFLWSISMYQFDQTDDNPLIHLSTIVYDELGVFKYKNNSFYLKALDMTKLVCMEYKSRLLDNSDMPIYVRYYRHVLFDCIPRTDIAYSTISELFYDLCIGQLKGRFKERITGSRKTLANVYNVSWDDAMAATNIENIDKCESCGLLLYDDVYIGLSGILLTNRYRDDEVEKSESKTDKPKFRDITPKKPALVCPYCFPRSYEEAESIGKDINIPVYALKTRHPTTLYERIPEIKDKFTRKFMIAMIKGEISRNTGSHAKDLIIKYKKFTYILCESEDSFIKRNPCKEDEKNGIYVFF